MNCQNFSDEELTQKSLQDPDWFRCLVERYEEKLQRYIRRLTNMPAEDQEDVLQEIFLNVYRNLYSFDPSLKFSSWIYRIAHNQVISLWRKQQRRPKIIFGEEGANLLEKMATEDDILASLNKQDLQKELESVLTKLKPQHMEVLVLKFLEEKSYQEISDILKKPPGTVASLINRAKKELRKYLTNDD